MVRADNERAAVVTLSSLLSNRTSDGEWRAKEADFGELYLEHEPVTPPDRLVVEDLAATMLVNSRVAARAAAAVYGRGHGEPAIAPQTLWRR